SVLGGLAFATPGVRRVLRLDGEGTEPFAPGIRRLPAVLLGAGGSAAVGALAGIVEAGTTGYGFGPYSPAPGVLLVIALLGGVSLFRRRGGIAGILVATLLYIVLVAWVQASGDSSKPTSFGPFIVVLAVIGFTVSIALDLIGRRVGARTSTAPSSGAA